MTESPFNVVEHWLERLAYDQAAEEMKRLDPAVQNCLEGLHIWALISEKRSDWQALEQFGKSLQRKDPGDPGGWFRVAESLHRRGRSKEAVSVLLEAESLYKKRSEFLYLLSRLHCGAGEPQQALLLMEEAYCLAPKVKDYALQDRDFEPIWLQLIDN